MTTILATVFVLGVLVFIHELGHFLAAKLFRIRVERFSLGYPPRMIGKKIGETDYCLSWVPFGGYVKISGMVDESMDTKQMESPPQKWEFRSRPWFQKSVVILAGPLMNLLLAYVIFVGSILHQGIGEYTNKPVVGTVVPGKPAAAAGLQPDDRILSINNEPIEDWDDLSECIHGSAGKTLHIIWSRGDSLFQADVIPVSEKVPARRDIVEVGLIGINARIEMRPASLREAFVTGGKNMVFITELIIVSIGKLISGEESIKSLAGPIFIAKMAGESARSGFENLIGFLAFLSLNLGILNLLPLPVLDGGHLLILNIEGIIRKTIPVRIKLIIQQVGMVMILMLMLFVIYQDIVRVVHK